MKYQEDLDLAKEKNGDFKKFLLKIKKDKNKKIDHQFSNSHDKVFEKIDCLECANCCKTTSPIFRDIDIKRISKKMKIAEKQFVANFLKMDDEKDFVLQKSPCAFLGADNKCDIYEDRPLACREYPHTDRKNMYQIMDITLQNTLICPAVSRIVSSIELTQK